MKVNELVVMQQLISDHKAICFQLNFQKPLNERKSVVSRQLRNFDIKSFTKMTISSGLLADASDLPLELLVDRYDNRMITSCVIPWTYWIRTNLGPSSFAKPSLV